MSVLWWINVLALVSVHTNGQAITGAKSFSSATKEGRLTAGEEQVLYETNDGPGYFTEMWFTGDLDHPSTVISIFIDGEAEPSIEFNLYLGHGIGCNGTDENQHTPWHTRHFGHEATGGGIYNTYRIPFGSSAVVKATTGVSGIYWFIVHGMLNAPLVVDRIQLPSNTRLKLYKQENKFLQSLEFLTMVNITGKAGWLYQATLASNSSNLHYLEACFRARIDDENIQFLSSGTEDFFLSAYYFDRGIFMADQSGLTCKAANGSIGAYKFFSEDPIFFTKSFALYWRCGEGDAPASYGGNCSGHKLRSNETKRRVRRDRLDFGQLSAYPNTTATTYTWVYEY